MELMSENIAYEKATEGMFTAKNYSDDSIVADKEETYL